MKRYRVVIAYGDGEKFWMFAYGETREEAIQNAENSISVIECSEDKED